MRATQIFSAKNLTDSFNILHENKDYELAVELGWLPQEVDLAIWEYDRQSGRR